MAEQSQEATQQRQLAASLPLPPPFYKDFTPEKLARFDELLKIQAEHDGTDLAKTRVPLQILPEDLINLQPPLPPADGVWRCFGDRYTLRDELPSLEDQGITRLVPLAENALPSSKHQNRELELKRLAKSLILNFLEVVSLLANNPGAAEQKAEDLRTLFINFHHVLNEYRPHQARESLIALMQDQLDRKRAETQMNREAADKATRVLEGLASIKIPDDKTLFPPLFEEGEDKPLTGAELDAARLARLNEIWDGMDACLHQATGTQGHPAAAVI